jgi:hypothetical protein
MEDPSQLLEQALLTPLDDGASDGGCGEQRHAPAPAGTRYHQQYLHMASWLAVLAAGYAEQRAACQVGLPSDGLRQVCWAAERAWGSGHPGRASVAG